MINANVIIKLTKGSFTDDVRDAVETVYELGEDGKLVIIVEGEKNAFYLCKYLSELSPELQSKIEVYSADEELIY